jgi:outer membrane protein assembly factor BamB
MMRAFLLAGAAILGGLQIQSAALADWSNAGGNVSRNGQSPYSGPESATPLWPAGTPIPSAIISYQPIIEGNRVFMVRQNAFIPNNVPNDSPIVCKDLHTGATLWTVNIPFNSGEWTTWVGGAKNGRVYAARGGNGGSSSGKLHCLDAATGAFLWPTGSQALVNAGSYDGMSFAPNGDPIVAGHTMIWRINQSDGTTMWSVPRLCSVSGNCGPAVFGDAIYVVDAAVGGHVLKRFNINTGAFQYASPLMPGFTIQNSPMVGPDGTIYVARVQNNVNVDFFYSFHDDGAAITENWKVAARWTTSSEFTVGPDGTIYMIAPGNVVSRRDPKTGAEIDASLPIALDAPNGNFTPRMASDEQGRIYMSNGQFNSGRVYCFSADLVELWSVPVPSINIGTPAIGANGILIVAGVGTNVKAYDTPDPVSCVADIAPLPKGNGAVDVDDLLVVINTWGTCPNCELIVCQADIAPDGGDCEVNVDDLLEVINGWGLCD